MLWCLQYRFYIGLWYKMFKSPPIAWTSLINIYSGGFRYNRCQWQCRMPSGGRQNTFHENAISWFLQSGSDYLKKIPTIYRCSFRTDISHDFVRIGPRKWWNLCRIGNIYLVSFERFHWIIIFFCKNTHHCMAMTLMFEDPTCTFHNYQWKL